MGHKIKLSIAQEGSTNNIQVEGEIPDDEWEVLQSFSQSANKLFSTKLVQDGMPSSLKIKGTSDGQMSFEAQLPNWDDVVLFLYYLRPIYLQSEKASFYAVCNILSRRLDSPDIRSMIQIQKDIYSGKLLRSVLRISVDDNIVNSEEILSTWLNAHEYHHDLDKRKFLDTINQMIPLDAAKVLFIQLLTEKLKAIAAASSMVGVVLGEQKNMSAPSQIKDGKAPNTGST